MHIYFSKQILLISLKNKQNLPIQRLLSSESRLAHIEGSPTEDHTVLNPCG